MRATLVVTKLHYCAHVLGGHQDAGHDDGFANFIDMIDWRKLRRVVHQQFLAVGSKHLVNHSRRRGDQVDAVLALKPLLDNLHVQHAEKATAKAEAQSARGLRLKKQCGVVEAQFLQRLAKALVVVAADREQAGKDARPDLLETG